MSVIYNHGNDVIGAAVTVQPKISIDWYKLGREFYQDLDSDKQAVFLAAFSYEISKSGVAGLTQLAWIAASIDAEDRSMVVAVLKMLLLELEKYE